MSALRPVLALLCLGWPAGIPADVVRAAIATCLAAMDAETDAASTSATESCPDLETALKDSPYAHWLPWDWAGALDNRAQLTELDRLLELETAQPSSPARTPDPAGVATVLDALEVQTERELSAWRRLVLWLNERLSEDDESPAWLRRWFERLASSPRDERLIVRGLLVLIVVIALVVVVNELRAAGILRWSWRSGRTPESTPAAPPGVSQVSGPDEIEAQALEVQPSLLLELLLARLARVPASALTHRELPAAVRVPEGHLAEFECLTGCAERVRYAHRLPEPSELRRAVAAGRTLLAAPAERPPSLPT